MGKRKPLDPEECRRLRAMSGRRNGPKNTAFRDGAEFARECGRRGGLARAANAAARRNEGSPQ